MPLSSQKALDKLSGHPQAGHPKTGFQPRQKRMLIHRFLNIHL
jgi:hypothetical protein